MAEIKYIYRCGKCGRVAEAAGDKDTPVCCEKIMVKDPLDQCTIPDHPEMVRNTYDSEPCDDNRGKETSGE